MVFKLAAVTVGQSPRNDILPEIRQTIGDGVDITEVGAEIHFHVRARSFLHNQVRSFVGTLERVGAGTWSPGDVLDALNAKSRAACGPVSPPHGLYLNQVGYPDDPFADTA